MVCPVSSETIFTAKNPGSSAGWRQISSMRDRSSARVTGALVAGMIAREDAGKLGDCALTMIAGEPTCSRKAAKHQATSSDFLLRMLFMNNRWLKQLTRL